MNKPKAIFATIALLGLTALIVGAQPKVPPLIAKAFIGTAPSTSSPMSVTSTSTGYFVPLGYIRLTCTGATYYKVVATQATAITSATSGVLVAPDPLIIGKAAITRSVWVNVTSDQWLALLKRGTGVDGYCIAELGSVDGVSGAFTDLTVSGTLGVTGVTTIVGGSVLQGTTKTGVLDAGATIVNGTFNAVGAALAESTLTAAGATVLRSTLQADGISKLGTVDAGAGIHNGTLNVVGAAVLESTGAVNGSFTLTGDNLVASTKTRGSGALDNASPSIRTATVNSGAICVCSNNTTQTNPVKCAVSGTTLTITGPNTTTDTVSYICMQ